MPDPNENAILHLAGKPPRPATDAGIKATQWPYSVPNAVSIRRMMARKILGV